MASVQDLSSKYGSQLRQLKAIFPTWDEGDLAFTLQDVKGSVEDAALAITEGRASQFTEAPSKKKATKPTAKESTGRGHSNRNADSGGWENAGANGDRGDRAARGGRGGARGGRGGGRGGEPFRGGGRGGRGGARGGRGGYSNTNGAAQTAANGEASTTDTTTDGWAAQVERASGADDGGWAAAEGDAAESSIQAAAAASGKGDDFAAAGGWGDAPSAKEVSKAAKSGGQGWAGKGKQAVSAVNTAAPAPAVPAKKTWAQIAKPVEKPKPVPAPAPAKEEPKPAAVEETPAPAEEEPQATEEQVEAFGDAPAPQEIEEQAAAIPETQAEVEPAVTQPDVPLEPETQQEEAEFVDPAIAGSGGTGSQPSWAQTLSQGKTEAPEPVTTYTGPPGFDSTQTTKGPVAQAQAQQPRSNSRAAQRFKNAEGQGVVLPGSVSSGLNNMDMQFGSLSFGALNPDGSDVPVPEQATPAKSAAQLSPVTSPRGLQQPSAPAAPLPQVAQQQQQPAASSYPYMSQQTQPGFPQSQPTQHQQQPQAQQQLPHSVQLQQQASAYQHLHQQQQHQHQQSQEQQSVAQQQPQQQPQQHQYYRPNDFYGAQSHDLGSSHNQTPSQQQQPVQPPSSASPYDSAFGAFGQQQSHQQLYGQAQQHQQHSTPSQNDAFSAGRQAYDSYGAAGYGRPSEEPKPPISAPPPSHTPTAPAQQQQQQPQGLQQQQHQQYQGYPQMGNMGYYQNAAYNPYYQYGQAPQPGFQQYYPLAGRNLYGQPTPPAPPAPIPQSKPAHASPYGAHGQPYPSSTYDDQSSYNGGGGRFGGSDIKAPSAQSTGAYSNPSLHGFLGQSTNSSSRQQASTPDEGFKSSTPQSSVGGASQQAGAQAQQQPNQRAGGPQGFGAGAGAGYPYSGGYQAQAQDWSQYGQYGGGRNGGYGSWGQQ